jgi:hypothetical protein
MDNAINHASDQRQAMALAQSFPPLPFFRFVIFFTSPGFFRKIRKVVC